MNQLEEHTYELARSLAARLAQKGLTMAVAEATCCGLIGYLLTSVPGSSRYFLGGVAPYSRAAKIYALGIPSLLLDQQGSVSREAALGMAKKVRSLFDADVGLAETGIAGPGGGTAEKPVGLFYIAVSGRDGRSEWEEWRFSGSRDEIRWQAAEAALGIAEKCYPV